MFVIRFVLVSCFGLVILKSVEAEFIKGYAGGVLVCENVTKITREVLNENYENFKSIRIWNTSEPFGISPFTNMKNLKIIQIGGSRIGIIYSETFKDLSHLQYVYIDHVIIGDIQESVFYNLPQLEKVEIMYTNIPFLRKGIFRNVPQLSLIYLQNNNIRYIENEPFYNVPYLKVLLLHNNLLTVVTKDMMYNLANLVHLNLANNSISIIEKNSFDATPILTKLNLEDNQLKTLDLDIFPSTGMENLKVIYLNSNQLMYLPSKFFTRTPALEEIGLSHNPWFCPCLFKIYGILNRSNIREVWVKEICIKSRDNPCKKPMPFSPWRLPICINRNVLDINCINTYSPKLSGKYLKYTKDYNEFFGHDIKLLY
ncbi:unnamed protein product [Psylliodes chrysocephalus]|uniref:Uncharacterized protein n=1 Tax=Psylliodes chrysocephalus TaxID=3402493 RepID=A0A9P0CND0_9CUCU|nr:unnamed protein product [Psylliodes chrysocephala]